MKFKCSFCKNIFDSKEGGVIRFWREKKFNICNNCKNKADLYIQRIIEKEKGEIE